MSDVLHEIKKAQKEIRKEGHAGWGNLLDEVITEIERLRSGWMPIDKGRAKVKGKLCVTSFEPVKGDRPYTSLPRMYEVGIGVQVAGNRKADFVCLLEPPQEPK